METVDLVAALPVVQNLQGKTRRRSRGKTEFHQAFDTILMQGIDHLCELCDGICGCSIRSFRSKIQGLCAVSPIIHALLFRRRRIYIGRLRKGGPLKKLVGRHQFYCIDTAFF